MKQLIVIILLLIVEGILLYWINKLYEKIKATRKEYGRLSLAYENLQEEYSAVVKDCEEKTRIALEKLERINTKLDDVPIVPENDDVKVEEKPLQVESKHVEYQPKGNVFISIDFEYLYHSHYDSPCAVGMVKVVNNVVAQKFYTLIYQPKLNLPLAPNNGITPDMVADAPTYIEVYEEMARFVAGCRTIVAHNASVEKKILSETPRPNNVPDILNREFVDTDHLSGHRSLKDLCEEYNIPLNHHNALSDAEACAEVYLRLIGEKMTKEVVRKVPHSAGFASMATADNKEAETFGSLPREEWICEDFPLCGKHVCVSGEYQSYSDRGELRRQLMKRGVVVDKSILKNTEVLVSGSVKPAGPSKTKKILERGGTIITENELIAMMQKK